MLGGRNIGLELVGFAFSAETSSELEACHWKHSALTNFQQSELKPSSPQRGTAPARSPLSDPLANGLWIQHPNHPPRYRLTQLPQRAVCDFSRKSSSLTSVDAGLWLLLLPAYRKQGQLCREQPLDCPGLLSLLQPQKPPPESQQAWTAALGRAALSSGVKPVLIPCPLVWFTSGATHLSPSIPSILPRQDQTVQVTFLCPQWNLTLLAPVTQGCLALCVTEQFGKIYHHLTSQTGLLFQSWMNGKCLSICMRFTLISSAEIWRVPACKYLLIGCLENHCFLQGLDHVFKSYLAMETDR